MANTATIQAIIPNNLYVSFDRSGNPSLHQHDAKHINFVASEIDKHYGIWNRLPFKSDPARGVEKGFGPGLLIASFETVAAGFLQYLARTPATLTNLFTTLSELFQVIIANYSDSKLDMRLKQHPEMKEEIGRKRTEQKKFREKLVAGVISLAGGLGLFKWGKEMFGHLTGQEEEVSDLSLAQKFSLSGASLLSAFGMFAGYSEKTSLAPIAKPENGGVRHKEMKLNGESDFRCTIEWLIMTAFPFLVDIKPVKALIDFVLPVAALRDGLGHFYEEFFDRNNNHSHGHAHVSECNHGFTGLVSKFLGLNGNGKKDMLVPKMFFNKWFFGSSVNSGIRNTLLVPLYKLFGCEPPKCFYKDGHLVFDIDQNKVESASTSGLSDNLRLPSDTEDKDVDINGSMPLRQVII